MKKNSLRRPVNQSEWIQHHTNPCPINLTLSLEDREALVADNILPEMKEESPVEQNVPLEAMIHLATIDKYQGKKNDIVILSTVRRSNKTVGFLKSANHTNVALSRARHGLFVVGNASLFSIGRSNTWKPVIELFKLFLSSPDSLHGVVSSNHCFLQSFQ